MKLKSSRRERESTLGSRREFLKRALITGAVLTLPTETRAFNLESSSRKKVLILGGTYFIGPVIVTELLKHNHELTLFNRGKTNPQLFPQLEKLRGNRYPEIDNGLRALEGNRKWDVVIDTCGYLPRVVKASVALLQNRIEQYVFVSTGGAYAPGATTEEHPLRPMEDETYEGDMPFAYVVRKAACDRAVRRMMPDQATVIRPYIITGPTNPDRTYFTYWPVRVQRGGEVLAPGTGADPILFIDVREMAEWIVGAIEHRHLGAYNMAGPGSKTPMSDYLKVCNKVSGGRSTFTWVSQEFLAANKMTGFGKIPMWRPNAPQISSAKAIQAGLRFRPLSQLIREEWHRYKTQFPGYEFDKNVEGAPGQFQLSRQKETELLQAWYRQQA